METLQKQVRRAHRRLVLQRFLGILSWCWFTALLAAAVAIGVCKYWSLAPEVADWHWVVGALAVGGLAGLVWTLATRRSALDAAIELDRRFALKERVSSALSLSAAELQTEAGQALKADALKRVEKIYVPEQFRVTPGRWSWLPLAPAALAFLVATFVEPPQVENPAEAKTDPAAVRKQVKKSTEQLQQKLIERRKEAREKGLTDAENLFEKLERGTKELTKGDMERKQAMVNLNDLAKDLEKRRQELAGSEKMKQQLNQLKDLQQGPADKLAKAMKDGDLAKAMKELDQLRQDIQQGKLDPKAQKQLAEQMGDMQKKLQKMVEDHKQKQTELAEQIKKKRESGQNAEAQELQQKLDQMAQQDKQMEQLQQMAEKMAMCAKCMQEGKSDEAMSSLESMKADLNDLQQQLDELAMLDQAMDEISEAKNGMSGGRGRGEKPGDGLGEGRGYGDRPEERTDVKFHDSTVKQKTGKGAAIVTGFVDGPNIKGEVQQEIKQQVEAARSESADPLTGQRLPRDYRDHAKGYFDAFREGQK